MAQQFDYPKTETQLREIQDALYQHSKEVYEAGGRPAFKGLLEIMSAESTIITAIHNIKGNHGSETPGVDSKTMRKDYLQKPFPWVVADRITDEQQLERIMDGLCDFCDEIRFIELYRSLCRHIYYQYPQLVGEHVALFRALFEGPDEN